MAHLTGVETNQLWRNLLLALSLQGMERFDLAHVAVLACANDEKARQAVIGVEAQLQKPREHLRSVTLEDLATASAEIVALAPWAAWFQSRYLDWEAPDRGRAE